MRQDDPRTSQRDAPPAAAGDVRPDRYEPPRILKKRAVARIASQFSGGGPNASGPLLVADG
jgi:hypothetical protein